MQEYRRTDQMCLFIRYSVLGKHTIIYVTELVILFLIILANKGKKQCLPNDNGEVHSIFHITFIDVLNLSFRINGKT